MYRSLALAAILAVSASPVMAQPTASLPTGFSFEDWLIAGSPVTVGTGAVDIRDKVFFVKEKAVAGFQSWYIFFDPSGTQSVAGSVLFGEEIVGLITDRVDLESSAATYGLAAGINYGYATATGLEGPDAASYLNNTLTFSFVASDPGDHIRVLTRAAVPEPESLALLTLGVAGLGLAARRRRTA